MSNNYWNLSLSIDIIDPDLPPFKYLFILLLLLLSTIITVSLSLSVDNIDFAGRSVTHGAGQERQLSPPRVESDDSQDARGARGGREAPREQALEHGELTWS